MAGGRAGGRALECVSSGGLCGAVGRGEMTSVLGRSTLRRTRRSAEKPDPNHAQPDPSVILQPHASPARDTREPLHSVVHPISIMADTIAAVNQPLPGTAFPTAAPPPHSVSASSADRLARLEAALPQLARLSPPPTQESIECLRGLCRYTPLPPAEAYVHASRARRLPPTAGSGLRRPGCARRCRRARFLHDPVADPFAPSPRLITLMQL